MNDILPAVVVTVDLETPLWIQLRGALVNWVDTDLDLERFSAQPEEPWPVTAEVHPLFFPTAGSVRYAERQFVRKRLRAAPLCYVISYLRRYLSDKMGAWPGKTWVALGSKYRLENGDWGFPCIGDPYVAGELALYELSDFVLEAGHYVFFGIRKTSTAGEPL